MTDAEFLHSFETAELPREEWTHEAHVRMAYLYLRSTSTFEEAEGQVRSGIQAYNAAQGNHTGYHETITVAFLRLIAHRIAASSEDAATWATFSIAHRDLLARQILYFHYDKATLFSPRAREQFVPPNRSPLP